MGGNSASTPELNQLGQLFAGNSGYQQPNQVAPVSQPQLQTPILPTPEQAAAATQARMQARTPMAAPRGAPQFGSLRDAMMAGTASPSPYGRRQNGR